MKLEKLFSQIAVTFIKILRWFIDPAIHGISILIAFTFTISFGRFLENWENPLTIKKVFFFSELLKKNEIALHILLGIIVFSSVHVAVRIIKRFWKGGMASSYGFFFYSQNSKKRQIKKSKNYLKSIAKKYSDLYILGASGFQTFAHKDSPLYEALETCNKAQIILLNPLSKLLIKRATDIAKIPNKHNEEINNYREEIQDSINYLTELVSCGVAKHIELKFYSSYPSWKIVIVDRLMWVQQYLPYDHVIKSPCMAFERKENQLGGYGHFRNVFLRRWESHLLGKYNFATSLIEFTNKKGEIYKRQPIIESRKFERKDVLYEAFCFCKNGDKHKVFVDNISENGIGMIFANGTNIQNFYKGKTIELKFKDLNLKCIMRDDPKAHSYTFINSIGSEIIESPNNYKDFVISHV